MGDMLGSAAAGAGFELLFGSLLRAILQLKNDNAAFKSTLEFLERSIKSMEPLLKRIDAYNRDFDRVHEIDTLKEIIDRGIKLVQKSRKVHKYNFIMKQHYVKKFMKLERDLHRYTSMDMQVNIAADQKETLFEVKSFGTQMINSIKNLSFSSSITGGGSTIGSFGFVGSCLPPKPKVEVPVGLEIPLEDLKKFLLDNDSQSTASRSFNNTPIVVVSAPGGCGKTTLALTLCDDEKVKEKFKNIFYLTVSKQPSLMGIIKRIFQHHTGVVPNFQGESEEDALHQLEAFLKSAVQEPKLLVLDDVWAGSESLIDKLKFPLEKYKILVTSRYEFPTFGSTYKLHTLNDTDAMTLFRQVAFPSGGNYFVPDQDDLEKFVKCLKGHPLVISVIAKSLCFKPAAEWRRRMNECSKAASILSDSNILDRLQSSMETLDVKVKECFKDLGSFPEDHKIPAPTLIDMWVELHQLNIDYAISNLHELSNLNLLDLFSKRKTAGEDDGIYSEHFVTQHDLLRELAIQQSNSESIETRKRLFVDKTDILEWQRKQNQLCIHASLLSICTDEEFRSIWCDMEAPEVEVLILHCYSNNNYTLPEFMRSMSKLKVLVITNRDFFPSELRNFQLLGALSNLKRIRLEKVSIPSNLFGSAQLKNLKKISFLMCNVSCVVTNISSALPNLEEINIDYCNDLVELPAEFCNLHLLKWLSITNCHKLSRLPDETGKLLNLEVLRLNSCTELTELPQTIGILSKLRLLDLSDCLSMTALPKEFGDLSGLRKLFMIDCSNCELPDEAMHLTNLKEVIGDEETINSWKLFQTYLTNLKTTIYKDVNLNWLK